MLERKAVVLSLAFCKHIEGLGVLEREAVVLSLALCKGIAVCSAKVYSLKGLVYSLKGLNWWVIGLVYGLKGLNWWVIGFRAQPTELFAYALMKPSLSPLRYNLPILSSKRLIMNCEAGKSGLLFM